MSVNITLENSFVMGTHNYYSRNDLYFWHCQHKGSIKEITKARCNPPSRNLKIELTEILQSLPEADRQLGVILMLSCIHPYTFEKGVTRLIIYGELLERIRSAHPGIILTLPATLTINSPSTDREIIAIPFQQKLLHSTETEYYKPEDLTKLNMTTGTNCFITGELFANNYKFNITEAKNRITLSDFTLTLKLLDNEEAAELIKANLMINPTYNKGILSKGQHTDLVIVAQDGTEFNCHKCFITAQSDVFEAMFASGGLQEGQTSRIEITDTSKEGIQALLGFIYAFDIEPARENAEIALELLQAGHKYNIRELEDSMKRVILTWPEKMLEIDSKIEVVIGLFSFARNVDGLESIKKRAFEVLQLRSEELMSCELYKELFKKDLSAAMELCALALRR